MLQAVLALVILGGFFVLRGIAATIVFFYLLPAGDRCPNCDGVTIRVESRGQASRQVTLRSGETAVFGSCGCGRCRVDLVVGGGGWSLPVL